MFYAPMLLALCRSGEFADANEELLKTLPPPRVAVEYYLAGDLYMFDEFQTSQVFNPRRPPCKTLHDVFINIRDDEGEHVKTMAACQDTTIIDDLEARKQLHRDRSYEIVMSSYEIGK